LTTELQKVILLTGASTGLGLTIAKKLIKENYHLVLTARPSSMERFKTCGIEEADNVWFRPLDVTDQEQRIDLILEINQRLGGVDILINNAGFTFRSVVEHVQEDERIQQMDTNFLAPMELTRLVLPFMRGKREGRIINISSVGGMMAMPTMAIYSASKWALEGSTESLWYEVKPWNIKVTLIQPGFINSDSFLHVRDTKKSKLSKESNDNYHNHYKNMSSLIAKVMKLSPSNAEDVANKTLKVIKAKNPPLRVAGTFDAHLFSIIRRILPRRLYHSILYYTLPGISKWGQQSSAMEDQTEEI
jgi:short-subunit dehydrogenase